MLCFALYFSGYFSFRNHFCSAYILRLPLADLSFQADGGESPDSSQEVLGGDGITEDDVATVRALLMERDAGDSISAFDDVFEHAAERSRPSFTLSIPTQSSAENIDNDGELKASPRPLPILRAGSVCPKHFLCPITHEVLQEPVVASDGFTYEKQAITKWLAKAEMHKSPMTGDSLSSAQLVPNHLVRAMIVDYFEANQEPATTSKTS